MNIIITGSISFDEILNFPGKFVDYLHPEKLHQINVSFVVDRLEKQFGGTATNIAYNCQMANAYLKGKNKVKVLASIGKDGQQFVEFFEKHSIDSAELLIDKKMYSAFGSVITDRKDNQIWGFYYGASEKAKNINIKKYDSKSTFLVISANHPKAFIHFQKEAIKNKIDYMYDPGMSLTWIKDKDLKEGMMNAKYFIGNDYEVAMILKRLKLSVVDLTKKGISVITTLGELGVRYQSKNEALEVKGYKVRKVIDPTGAGDAWRGGFVAGMISSIGLKESLKLGNVMASFAIEKYGTANHKPTAISIEKRLKGM